MNRPRNRPGPAGDSDSSNHLLNLLGDPRSELARALGRLIDLSPLAVIFLENLRIIETNRAARELFGGESGRLIGTDFLIVSQTDSIDEADVRATVSDRIEAALDGEPQTFPWRFLRSDGTEVDAEVHICSVAEGDTVYSLVIIRDATERHSLESQLRHAQKMELLGQLTGGIAHDFGNLLTAIEGHLDLALAGPGTSGDLRTTLETARRCTQRAGALSRRILDFSRNRSLEPRTVRLDHLVQEIARFLRRLIRADVKLNVNLQEGLHPISADSVQIEQAIVNLILNAENAMPRGGTLELTASNFVVDQAFRERYPWAKPGRYARLEVRDTGVGIAEKDQPHVFEPFFSSKPAEQGTGLGLAIVYGIVKQHRGFVGLESRPGRGTAFWILLPAEATVPAVDGPGGRAGLEEDETTVLIVEDEDVVRNVAASALRTKGYRVLEAQSAEDALHIFEEQGDGVDVLLTDLVLSGMSGRVLAERLVQLKGDLKVIYTSGYDSGQFPGDLGTAAGSTFLEKPYSLKRLVDDLRGLLGE